jgi:hypothetical protein
MILRATNFLSASTLCFVIIPVLSACGQLKPEAQKTRSADATYQELSVSATYDTSNNTWSYYAFVNLHADTRYGTRSALGTGESILINGEAPTNSGTATEPWYSISKTGTPPSKFTFVWTSADGRVFSNECAIADFTASGAPSTSSRTGSFSILFTTPEATGTARADLSQLEAGIYRSGGALSSTLTAENPSATLNFASAQMANMNNGSVILNLSWIRSSTLTNATAAGGDCQVYLTHKHTFALTD